MLERDREGGVGWVGLLVWLRLLLRPQGSSSGRSSVEVHGSCDGRISLYPAAPVRLATLLHAWTCRAGRMGLITRTAKWLDHSAKRFLSHRPAQRTPKERRNCLPQRADLGVGNTRMAPCGTSPCSA